MVSLTKLWSSLRNATPNWWNWIGSASTGRFDARKAQVVELRFFAGLSVKRQPRAQRLPQTVLRD